MTTITKKQAVDRLVQAIKTANPDDLVEIYNELFPEKPMTEEQADQHSHELVTRIDAHIGSGLEAQEILDLWNVIFPMHRRVRFDEDEGVMHYAEKSERVGQSP